MNLHARWTLPASALLVLAGCSADATPPAPQDGPLAMQEAPLQFHDNGIGAVSPRVHPAGPITAPYGEYAGVFRPTTGRSDMVLGADASTFLARWRQNGARNLRLVDVGSHLDASGQRVFDGVYGEGDDAHSLLVAVDEATFLAKNTELTDAGLRLADVKIYLENGQRRYVALWREGGGGYDLWLNADWDSFIAKWQSLAAANMRLVKLDVHEENGQLKYTGYWREGTDGYYLWVGASWNGMAQKWLELKNAGLDLVDLEAYSFGGQRLYAGVFRSGQEGDLLGSVDAAAFQNKARLEAKRHLAPVLVEYDPGAQQPPPEFAAALANLDHHAIGYAYAFADSGLLTSEGAVGYARAPWESTQPGVPMTSRKRTTIASMSKPITNVAMNVVLDELGGSLDDPFYPYVASRLPSHAPGVETITIRNLLNHDSGMVTNHDCGTDFWAQMADLVQQPLVGTPGATHAYANSNYCLVRAVIEARTNQAYGDWVQSKVLHPMGITDMSCAPDAQNATRYYVEGQTSGDGIDFRDYTRECAAYGWYASAADLVKFLRGVRTDEVLPHGVTRNQLLTTGWMNFGYARGTFYGHNGGWLDGARHGFEGAYFTDPDNGVDAVLLVNTVAADGAAPDFDATTDLVNGFQSFF